MGTDSRMNIRLARLAVVAVGAVAPIGVQAQTTANITALQGLMPVAVLANSAAGQAALSANYTVTGSIQTGSLHQPTLLPFPVQQQLALRDAVITSANAAELADALGTRLAAAYQSTANYADPKQPTNISPRLAALFAYTDAMTASDSNSGKYFFANATTDGRTPVADVAAGILAAAGGSTDIFGKAYHHPAGTAGADPFGNSRPFQTEPGLTRFVGPDYFGIQSSNDDYLRGPAQDLTASPSFPSGHTTYGYTEALLLAIMVPQRFRQEITRAAEYGNDRIILGAHYTMDVLAGRALALHDVAQLLANNPAYVGRSLDRAALIADYQAAMKAAQVDLVTALQAACGDTVAVCAAEDVGRFANPEANETFYEATQTYGLPVVHQGNAIVAEDVAKMAPEAGYILTFAFPYLTLAQADEILTVTEGPGGSFLDNGSPFGLYSRLDLYAAGKRAAALAPAR